MVKAVFNWMNTTAAASHYDQMKAVFQRVDFLVGAQGRAKTTF